jgi:transcriptional regulatory protein GAL4
MSIRVARNDTFGRMVCHVSARIVGGAHLDLTQNNRYFLFHSALVITLCVLSFPHAIEMQQWLKDIRMARSTFRENLGEDSLSARCVAILDQVVAEDKSDTNPFQSVQLDENALNTFPWSVEASELFNSFDWDLSSNAF